MGNMQLITDYILSGKEEKTKECQKEIELSPEQEKAIEELKKYHREIQQENFKIAQLEQELKERQEVTKLEKCVEFMRGIIADEVITDVETEALTKYRQSENIDDNTYQQVLSKLDLSLVDIEDMQKKQDDTGGKMCIICHERPKQDCIFPCMHVVVCQVCAGDLKNASGPGSGTCPACHEPFEKIERVYIE